MLQVWFFDGKKLPATVLTEHGNFCLLGTPKHEDCVGITWSQESLDPDTVFMFVPKSPKKTERKDAYLAVESVQAYLCEAVDSMEPNSDDYFMILCDYFEGKVDGVNRLAAAPIFTMSGNVLGLVLQNCREGELGEAVTGTEMKVVMKASAVKRLLES
ncbi:hypothetical protein C2845_PM09G09660 [Panicum miliaceum]|uniref:Uncharacterized protein n=1 Tax=Panicum miliaceum TaxID=4540 RepID=A0A3L6S0D0_PANMI|nr:hypothetical protein C2845_PM09G09660 [Panicum miliaceum]